LLSSPAQAGEIGREIASLFTSEGDHMLKGSNEALRARGPASPLSTKLRRAKVTDVSGRTPLNKTSTLAFLAKVEELARWDIQ
jgi:hypothetical protein